MTFFINDKYIYAPNDYKENRTEKYLKYRYLQMLLSFCNVQQHFIMEIASVDMRLDGN